MGKCVTVSEKCKRREEYFIEASILCALNKALENTTKKEIDKILNECDTFLEYE
jgi:hypothetical protein